VLDEISVETIQNSNLNSLMALTADLMTQGINSIRKQEKEKRILKRHHKLMRRTGYAADSEGIIERYINVGDAWENHLDHCRKFILRSVGKKKYKNIAVFGSGWLLDVPLELLANASEEVYLYDVVHPAQVMHKISRYPNVKAITADVTGGVLEAVNEAVNVYKKTGIKPDLVSLFERQFRPEKEPDYIISLNILSQLGEIISDYLLKNIPMDISPDEISSWLQRAHLQMMKPGKSCMITDIEECLYDVAGQLVKTKKLVFCPMPDGQKETWDWQFDPLGEYNPGMKTVSRVAAVEF
jgi:hypothetical protein